MAESAREVKRDGEVQDAGRGSRYYYCYGSEVNFEVIFVFPIPDTKDQDLLSAQFGTKPVSPKSDFPFTLADIHSP